MTDFELIAEMVIEFAMACYKGDCGSCPLSEVCPHYDTGIHEIAEFLKRKCEGERNNEPERN